jgi:hypothetical protein
MEAIARPTIRPSIRVVARVAGVSVGSVSRVINGAPRLGAETERRVLAAIAELGYHPSKVARSLRLRAARDALSGADANRPLLISVGSLSFDSFVLLDAMPTPGERQATLGVQFFIGGPWAIVAVSARRLGAPFDVSVELCTVVGDDRESDEAVERLLSAGVGAGGILRDQAGHLPRCVVLVEPSGRRTILGSRVTRFPPGLRPAMGHGRRASAPGLEDMEVLGRKRHAHPPRIGPAVPGRDQRGVPLPLEFEMREPAVAELLQEFDLGSVSGTQPDMLGPDTERDQRARCGLRPAREAHDAPAVERDALPGRTHATGQERHRRIAEHQASAHS